MWSKILGKLDGLAYRIYSRGSPLYFRDGWGHESLSSLNFAVPRDWHRTRLSIAWHSRRNDTALKTATFDGAFHSPSSHRLSLPREACTGYVRLVVPLDAVRDLADDDVELTRSLCVARCPLSVSLPASGDQGFRLREKMIAVPLASGGDAGTLMLMIPYYAKRAGAGQSGGHVLATVFDLLAMGSAAVEEGLLLVDYCRRVLRADTVGVHGLSMGGCLSSLVAAYYQSTTGHSIPLAACIPSHSPAPVYTDGVISTTVDFDALLGDGDDSSVEGARERLRELLEHGSNVTRYEHKHCAPVIIVAARHDEFIERSSLDKLAAHFGHHELRWIDGGHVSAFLWGGAHFRRAIVDSLRQSPAAKL
jgi:dienelactone hydrolase